MLRCIGADRKALEPSERARLLTHSLKRKVAERKSCRAVE